MSPTSPRLDRRWFLRGAGGAALAMPVLSSLLPPRQARAAETGADRIFVAFCQGASGAWNGSVCPAPTQPDETRRYAGLTIQRTALRPQVEGGMTKLSEVLQAPSGTLTPGLVAKMNIIRGCDWPKPAAHNAAMLGNLGSGPTASLNVADEMRPSIDQVMGWSRGFYPTFTGVRRVLQVGSGRGGMSASFGYTNPEARTGAIVGLSGEALPTPAEAFNVLFGRFRPPPTTAPREARRPIVDLVLESYRRLARLHPRLSVHDRARLDDHVQRIADIERRLTATLPLDCAVPAAGTALRSGSTADEQIRYYTAFHDVVIAALSCGLTRVVVYPIERLKTLPGADMHQVVEHHTMEKDGVAQGRMAEVFRRTFAEILVPFAAKLDAVVDAGGKSLLDRSLVLRATEMGEVDHCTSGQVFLTFGSANGAVRTGSYLDYRNLERPAKLVRGYPAPLQSQHLGLTVQQLYGSLLRLMGIPNAEWAESNHGGYGKKTMGKLFQLDCCAPPPPEQFYTDQVWTAAGDVLPWLGA